MVTMNANKKVSEQCKTAKSNGNQVQVHEKVKKDRQVKVLNARLRAREIAT